MRQLIEDYYAAVRALNAEAWAAKFTEDVTMEDPVGSFPVRGRQGARQRYQVAVETFSLVDMVPQDVFVVPSTGEAVVRWSLILRFKDAGTVIENVCGISYFKFDDDHRIELFRAFWNPADLAASSRPQPFT